MWHPSILSWFLSSTGQCTIHYLWFSDCVTYVLSVFLVVLYLCSPVLPFWAITCVACGCIRQTLCRYMHAPHEGYLVIYLQNKKQSVSSMIDGNKNECKVHSQAHIPWIYVCWTWTFLIDLQTTKKQHLEKYSWHEMWLNKMPLNEKTSSIYKLQSRWS